MSTHGTSTSDRAWHVPADDLLAYQQGRVGGVAADSVEAHLLRCGTCREVLAEHAPAEARATTWAAIADAIDQGSRWNRSSSWLRLAAGTPQLALAGAGLAVAFVAIPLLLSLGDERAAVTWFLAVAPAVLLGGVLLAYRAAADPAGALAAATPLHSFRIVLMRACVLAALLVPAGAVTAALLPGRTTLLLGWVLPAIACSAVALAVATRFDPVWVAALLSAGWAAAVWASLAGLRAERVADALRQVVVNEAAVQATSLAVALAAAAVVVARRDDLAYGSVR